MKYIKSKHFFKLTPSNIEILCMGSSPNNKLNLFIFKLNDKYLFIFKLLFVFQLFINIDFNLEYLFNLNNYYCFVKKF